MNELIERLAREAGMAVDGATRVDLRDGSMSVTASALFLREPVDHLARFAALVAEQCAQTLLIAPSLSVRREAFDQTYGERAAETVRSKFPMPKP